MIQPEASGSLVSPSQGRSPLGLWLGVSLAITLYYGLVSIAHAFSSPYIVQDDVRQHVVWMQRFSDPQLFPNDAIAQYFQSVAPLGFKAVFAGAAHLGVAPLVFAKILPLLLGLATTVYGFYLFLELLPSPMGACLSTVILNQSLWLNDDLVSATPRAFVYPIFAAFLYYLLRRSLFPCLVALGLQGVFFPQMMLVQVGVLTLQLVQWRGDRLRLSQKRQDYLFWVAGMVVALVVIFPFSVAIESLGTPLTLEAMRSMPEYGLGGRTEYFGVSPLRFWFDGRSGIRVQLFPAVGLLGFALPLIRRSRVSTLRHLTPRVRILTDILLASLGWFGLAHLLLPRLYLPSRYNYHSLRIVLALSAAIVLTLLLNHLWPVLRSKLRGRAAWTLRDRAVAGLVGLLVAIVTLVPLSPRLIFLMQNWVVAETPALHQFLATQPTSTLVASLADEADNIPALALRSTLVGREFALAFHPDYYAQIQQRAIALLQLQYGLSPELVQRVIRTYGIDWIWVEDDAFDPDYLRRKDWLINSSFRPAVMVAIDTLERGQVPVIARSLELCTALRAGRSRLLDASCVAQSVPSPTASSD